MVLRKGKTFFLIFLGLCVIADSGYAAPDHQEKQIPLRGELLEGFVYHANAEKTGLKSAKISFSKGLDSHSLALEIIRTVFAGPSDSNLAATWPKDVKINSVFISRDGKAYVDLGLTPDVKKEMMQNFDTGSELLAVYSLVNSLTLNIPKIKMVKILLQGKDAETLAGHIDLDLFYKPNMLIVK